MLLLKILAGSSDLSSYSAKIHFINRKIRNNVASHVTDEKWNSSLVISYQNGNLKIIKLKQDSTKTNTF